MLRTNSRHLATRRSNPRSAVSVSTSSNGTHLSASDSAVTVNDSERRVCSRKRTSFAELRVVGQQHALRRAVDHQGRAGYVAVVPAVALEAAGLPQYEAAETRRVFVRIAGLVAVQRGEQPVAVQGGAQAAAGAARPSRSKISGNG